MSTSHEDSEPPSKRRRNDLESTQQEIVKQGALYFENGNIVLLSLPIDNTVTAFKLYKELLLVNSQVFEGMLSVPSPRNVEMYDGVPLVRLQDQADELLHFLKAIHDPREIPTVNDFYVSGDKAASVLKLSKKYDADKLFTVVTDVLLGIWPDTLLEWDTISERSQRFMFQGENRLKSSLPEPCNTIRLAREYDVSKILPVAFYRLFDTLPSAFMRTSRNARRGELWGLNSRFEVNLKPLSREDFMTFVRGSYAIREFIDGLYEKVLDHFEEREYPCDTNDACVGFLNVFAKKHVDAACSGGNLLGLLREPGIKNLDPSGFCQDCLMDYLCFMDGRRQIFWDRLPRFFELEKV